MNKLFKVMIFELVLSIFFIAGCSNLPKLPNDIKKLNLENVKSAKIKLATVGANPVKSYSFDLNDLNQVKTLEDVIIELKSAKVQGYAYEKISNMGSSPTILILELKNGLIIEIKPAIEDKVKKLSDGSTEITKSSIPNEVTISTNRSTKPIRILSPKICKLIDSGYTDIFK